MIFISDPAFLTFFQKIMYERHQSHICIKIYHYKFTKQTRAQIKILLMILSKYFFFLEYDT